MKSVTIAIALLFFAAILLPGPSSVSAQVPEHSPSWYIKNAPFPMEEPARPQVPGRVFNIRDYGANGDGQTLNTEVFEKTILACSAAGGGKVIVPAGAWLTGPIRLASRIDLHLERGAMILFTRDHTRYPLGTTDGGKTYAPVSPLYGRDLVDIAITGEGIIDGGGDSWRPVKKEKMTAAQWKNLLSSGGVLNSQETIWWPSREALDGEAYLKGLRKNKTNADSSDYLVARDFLRPVLLQLTHCRRILVEGVTLQNSPKFICYPNRCTDLTMDHVTIFNEWWAQNGDGIDISACKKVLLYKCTVSAGDDAICMKSSGGNDGQAALSEVIVAGCTVYHGHGGFVIGSNTDGGMHNIALSDCTFIGTDVGLRFKSNMGRGGLVDNIFIRNIYMRDIVNEAVLFDTYYEDAPAGSTPDPGKPRPADKTPEFRDFHISHVYCSGARTAIRITGLPQMPVHTIFFDNLVISAGSGLIATQAQRIDLQSVKLIVREEPAIQADKTADIHVR